MADIFLSYAREDKETAHRLADAIEARGFSVWWDAEIPPGGTWDQVIERELTAARGAVVIWSKTSVAKTWVRVEASEALKRSILIPVLIDSVEPPIAFRLTQAASLVGWRGEDDHPGFQQLIGALEHLVRDPSAESRMAAGGSGQPPRRTETVAHASATASSSAPRRPWKALAIGGGAVLALGLVGVFAIFTLSTEKPTPGPSVPPSAAGPVANAPAPAPQPRTEPVERPRDCPTGGDSADRGERPRDRAGEEANLPSIGKYRDPATTPPNSTNAPAFRDVPGKYPFTSQRYLTADELRGASAWDLKIMRNEIFARHGYIFRTDDMKRYFSQQPWYRGQSNDALSSLSPIELANVETIKAVESGRRTAQ